MLTSKATSTIPAPLPSDLLIGELSCPPIFTIDQLLFLGRNNLTYLLNQWQSLLKRAQPFLDRVALLNDNTVADFRNLATHYDNPDYPTKISTYRHGKALNTTDPDAEKRKAGTTTFNICGWCEHALSDGYPYCNVVTSGERVFRPCCGLINSKWTMDQELPFNQPCLLTHASDTDLEQMRDKIQTELQQYLIYYNKVKQHIAFLKDLIPQAEPKPLFAQCRTLKHYAKGTPVYYISYNYGDKTPETPYPLDTLARQNGSVTIYRGTIKKHIDYTYFTGSVEIHLRNPPDKQKSLEVTYTNSLLLSFEELAYLVQHPDYARLWIYTDRSDNGILSRLISLYQKYRYIPQSLV